MSINNDSNDNVFDFSEQVLGDTINEKEQKKEFNLEKDDVVHTSYMLVNALLNLLIRKGIIKPYEINNIVSELHKEYIKRNKEDDH